jgi:uncharacterized membrane protein
MEDNVFLGGFFGFTLSKEGKSHDCLGDARKGYLLAVHRSGVGNQNSDWHLLRSFLLGHQLIELEHTPLVTEVNLLLIPRIVTQRQTLH